MKLHINKPALKFLMSVRILTSTEIEANSYLPVIKKKKKIEKYAYRQTHLNNLEITILFCRQSNLISNHYYL